MKRIYILALLAIAAIGVTAQTIPFPSGPRNHNELVPWGYTDVGTRSWNTSTFLPFIYQNRWFRLMPPNPVEYNESNNTWNFTQPGEKYPLILFFHGLGEAGTDNNNQLRHGGQRHRNAVLSGEFPGFLLYPQSCTIQEAKNILDKIIQELPVDQNRIYVHGLSNGGSDTWKFTVAYPNTVAAAFPMSAASDDAKTLGLMYKPFRLAQGGLDNNPAPNWTQTLVNYFNNNGGHLEYFYLPNQGHGTWNTMYALDDFFTWFLDQKMNKIFIRYDTAKANEICPGDPVNLTMGLTPGFNNYEWRRNGVLMNGVNTHAINVTQLGLYEVRYQRGSIWSDWSDPVDVKERQATQTPPIIASPYHTVYLPKPDGINTTSLQMEDGYAEYEWYNSSNSLLGTNQTYNTATVGSYYGIVTEVGSCSSLPSPSFTVFNANGPNRPDNVSGLVGAAQSQTEIALTWIENPTPIVNEIGFEVFRSEAGSPYQLIATVPSNVVNYLDTGLKGGTTYTYVVRPIGPESAGDATAPLDLITEVDSTPPTAPGNLNIVSYTSTSVELDWDPSTDNTSVYKYEVYLNGLKALVVNGDVSAASVFGLQANQIYNITVKAKDFSNNFSVSSNQVTLNTGGGLSYKYYNTGNLNNLPNFNFMTPAATGLTPNVDISLRTQDNNFAFYWEGQINIPQAGTYTFYTNSDDGSKLYIGSYNESNLVVNNDGLHGPTTRSGNYTFPVAGMYPIVITFFERGGGESMQVSWRPPGTFFSVPIPSSAFQNTTAPNNPSGLSASAASFDQINLSWTDNSVNETAFKVFRSTNSNGPFIAVATLAPNAVNYTDLDLQPSTRYYYQIVANGSEGVSGASNTANAITATLPPPPIPPSNLVATATAPTMINLTWNDNDATEFRYEVWRSLGDNTNYILHQTLPANSTSFEDSNLFPRVAYYYQIVAVNDGGDSFSNEVNATTPNSKPEITPIADFTVRYDETKLVHITIDDPDGDYLLVGGVDFPSFGQVFDYGDGSADLLFSPAFSDLGVYNIGVQVNDGFGGMDTVMFTMTVNENSNPVISSFLPVNLKESETSNFTIGASDAEEEPLSWTIQNAPSFFDYVANGNLIEVTIAPTIFDAGDYVVDILVEDASGGSDTKQLLITVIDYDPNFLVQVNFGSATSVPAGWNNVQFQNAGVWNSLLTDEGIVTEISMSLDNTWDGSSGSSGVAPGAYPDNVQRSFIYATTPKTVTFSGLNPSGAYNMFIMSSRVSTGTINRNTAFTIPGHPTQNIQANDNAFTTVDFNGITPNSSGQIILSVDRFSSDYSILNAIVLESIYNGGDAPPAPANLAVMVNGSNQVALSWDDNAQNATGYQIYRSTDNVTFNLLTSTPEAPTSYVDGSVSGGTTYYYYLTATNLNGESPASNTVSIVAPNNAPVFLPPALTDIQLEELELFYLMVNATDQDNDVMTFSLQGAPSFVWLEDVTNGMVNLGVFPFEGDNGTYEFSIVVEDNQMAQAVLPLTIAVNAEGEFFVNVNFTNSSNLATGWNNLTNANAGSSINSLVDKNAVFTGIGMTLLDSWTGINTAGYSSGNNSGIYPDAATATSFFVDNAASRSIRFSGLNVSKLYDFTFFASRMGTAGRQTNYSAQGTTVSLNAGDNTSQTVTLVGLTPNANGEITITVEKAASSLYGYLNAFTIREYFDNGMPLAPENLTAQAISRTSVSLFWNDLSVNETGFEVWRSVGNNSGYSLLTTVGPDQESYTHTGLATGQQYFYKVRAINGQGTSGYTNESSAWTYVYSISLNMFSVNGGPVGWNNFLDQLPQGWTQNDLHDELGVNTGVDMTFVQEFTGTNPWGVNTGNNSGVYPDNVMEGSFWLDPGSTAVLRFENMSFLQRYNFVFFASRAGSGNRRTSYSIGNTTVTLDAGYNATQTASINNITPDEDGNVTVSIFAASGAIAGYLNALVIQAVPNTQGGGSSARFGEGEQVADALDETHYEIVKAYPNPFSDRIKLRYDEPLKVSSNIQLVNPLGIPVHSETITPSQLSVDNEYDIELNQSISGGLYILRVRIDESRLETIRLKKE